LPSRPSVQVFFNDPNAIIVSMAAKFGERSAQIRATFKFVPLDALHLATAVESGCALFMTNGAQLRMFPDIPVELLT
jgi:hypothetical protein